MYGSTVVSQRADAAHGDHPTPPDAPRRQTLRKAGKVAALLVAVGALAVFLPGSRSSADTGELRAASGAKPRAQNAASSVSPDLTMSNAYERLYNTAIAEGMYPFDFMAEIHRPTRLELDVEDGLGLVWTIDGYEGKEYRGNGVEVVFIRTGMHTLRLKLDGSEQEYTYSVKVSYVRREIRSMTRKDRSSFFDAMEVLYNVPQKAGENMYGDKFRSVPTLVEEHLKGSADKECDHWHDDAGIMTHHMAFTLEFEQSLQSVNKELAVPYWDYTYDSYKFDANWTASEVFQDEWFGPVESGSADHAIASGRWAYTTVMKAEGTDSRTKNSYGLLRSPWNTNPVPYLLRHRYTMGVEDGGWALPSCSVFQTAFDESTLGAIISALNGELHGPVHIMAGGHWSFNASINIERGLAEAGMKSQVADILLTSKFLWRQGLIRCPESCSADTPASECKCSCPSETRGNRGTEQIMRDYGVPGMNLWYSESFKKASGATDNSMLDLLCQVGHPGEMFTSAAPYDPLFWSLHGLAERFMILKILKAEKGETSLIEKWGYEHVDHLPSDTNLVCNWTGVEGLEMPDCKKFQTCPGHRAHDLLPMGNFLGNNETYTNKEFFEFIQPANENLPYTYDSFTRWAGCHALNITFGSTTSSQSALLKSDLTFTDGSGVSVKRGTAVPPPS